MVDQLSTMSHVYHSSSLEASGTHRKPLPPSYTPIAQDATQTMNPDVGIKKQEEIRPSSKWVLGWKTPTGMIACYLLALLFSITHLSMFVFLDNRPVASYRQSYVTTASIILASAYHLSLKAALGIAFTQKLWNLLRKSFQKLQTIEQLFTMRSNFASALHWTVLRSAPLLSLLTIVLWGLQIATTFPPGALTVVSRPLETNSLMTNVMALNTSFVGNGSLQGAMSNSPGMLELVTTYGLGSSFMNMFGLRFVPFSVKKSPADRSNSYFTYGPTRRGATLRSAAHTMISRSITTTLSPCGLNCTYGLEFLGPYLQCGSPSIKNATFASPSLYTSPIYIGVWSNPQEGTVVVPYTEQLKWLDILPRRTSVSMASFNTTIFEPWGLQLNQSDISNVEQAPVYAKLTRMECKAYQANYHVNVTYQNGAQSFNITTDSTQPLVDLIQPIWPLNCTETCTCCNAQGKPCSCLPTIDWTDPHTQQWLSSANSMAIIESMTLALAGQYNVGLGFSWNLTSNYTLPNGTTIGYNPVSTLDANQPGLGSGLRGPINGTIIASTAINQNINLFNNTSGPELVLTQDLLNRMLQNITLSLMNNFGIWTTDVNATQHTFRNVYSFSNKLNLLLPYFGSLLIALPLLAIGMLSFVENGVSATDGGFLQILTTTSASKTLHRVAEGGSLGGEENVPKELKELKIMFGELNSSRGARRAGFGTEDEVVPIETGARS
ncbi:uncharacterized protein PAC_15775 [Phialocephala subalpina]|uniref:Uncharacterized protein n=1 Tax=Phialocephala subalpina TaxID=576137 RepID=A0A1L7XLE5_9HELO|nr:uncharacterized protein PAC_15775 [Phialocephala subalpina]